MATCLAHKTVVSGFQVDVPPEEVERKGRLMPGNIFLVDFEKHAVVTDEDMKRAVSTKRPYGEWLASQTVTLQVSLPSYLLLPSVAPCLDPHGEACPSSE